MPPEATDILKPMSQARSSGQSIEMRRSADYLGFLGRSRSVQNPLPAVAPKATDGLRTSRANHTSQRLRGARSRLLQKFYSVKMPGQLWPLASFETSELCLLGSVFRLICFGWVNRCRE
jgi:hypothetical protein